NEDMNYLKKDMDEIPELIREAQKELPGQFQDLKYGCRDLKVEGYDLDHVKIDSSLQTLKTELSFVEPMISRLELDEANDKLNSINDRLDEMYELIEHEVKAKNEVEETKEVITDNLFRAKEMNYTLQTKIEYVRENYYINESDVQNVRQFENEIQSMISVYDEILQEKIGLDERYEIIKNEVKAKNEVKKTKEVITDNLFRDKEMNYTLQTEIKYVRENYYINESDVQNVRQFKNEIQSMISVYDEILQE